MPIWTAPVTYMCHDIDTLFKRVKTNLKCHYKYCSDKHYLLTAVPDENASENLLSLNSPKKDCETVEKKSSAKQAVISSMGIADLLRLN